jgi:ParB family protein of integrating conjugative element (PFGI_1 class)
MSDRIRSILPPGPIAGKPGIQASVARLQKRAQGMLPGDDTKPADISPEIRRSVAVGVPLAQPNTLKQDDIFRNLASFPIDRIDLYEKNPRTTPGENYEQLKESIRVLGIKHPFSVTRRPTARNYVVAAGGNSRLRAVKELFNETQDKKFASVEVIETPYTSELRMFADHIIENNARDPLHFWDNSRALAELKREIEVETGKPLGLRTALSAFAEQGVHVDFASLGFALFAVNRLSSLGQAAYRLSMMAVRRLQPELNKLVRLAERAGHAEDEIYQQTLNAAFNRYGTRYEEENQDNLNEDELLSMCNVAVAERLSITSNELHTMTTLAEQFRELTWNELKERARTNPPSITQSVSRKLTTPQRGAAPPSASVAPAMPLLSPASSPFPRIVTEEAQGLSVHIEADEFQADIQGRFDHRTLHRFERQHLHVFLLSKVELFAKAHGVDHCVKESDAFKHGFYMEVPKPALSFDDEALSRPAPRFAWWTLATIARQFSHEYIDSLTQDSLLRRIYTIFEHERDGDIGMSQGEIAGHTGGMPASDAVLECLLDATCVGQEPLADMLAMVRAIGIIEAERQP